MKNWMMNSLILSSFMTVLVVSFLLVSGLREELMVSRGRVTTLEDKLAEAYSVATPEPQGGVEVNLDDIPLPIHADDYIDYSSPFGLRRSPFTGEEVHHPGLDLYGTWRARVVSIGPGTVIEHWVPPGQVPGYSGHEILGGCIVIQMDDGVVVTLGHLSETFIHEGDRLVAGQVIGRQGSTGVSTGEHVHFEVSRDGQTFNPFRYLIDVNSAPVSDADPFG